MKLWSDMTTGEQNSFIDIEVIGRQLKPDRDTALIRIGRKYTTSTGHIFQLSTGDDLTMPNQQSLRKPDMNNDWSACYFLYVGEFLCNKYPDIAAKMEAFQYEPKPYVTHIGDAIIAMQKMMRDGYDFHITCAGFAENHLYDCIVGKNGAEVTRSVMKGSMQEAITETLYYTIKFAKDEHLA